MKRLAIIATTVALVLGISAPAQAVPVRETFYATVGSSAINNWFWVDEQLGIIGCPRCRWMIDLRPTISLPQATEIAMKGNIMSGLNKRTEGRVTADPAVKARLRAEAQALFVDAARLSGPATLRVGTIGYWDPDRRVSGPSPQPWLESAHLSTVDAMAKFKTSLGSPEPTPWLAAGMAAMDAAVVKLATKH